MSGLDKISDTIVKEAEKKAEDILAQAKAEAQSIAGGAQKTIDAERQKYADMAKRETEAVNSRFASENRQKRSQALLKTKRMVIEDTIAKAKEKIKALPDGGYFDFLRGVLVKNARQAEGELYLAQKDFERMPKDFIAKCNAEIKGGSVKLAGPTGAIANGFMIVYGKIEQNCSIDSIFESNNNLLEDTVKAFIGE